MFPTNIAIVTGLARDERQIEALSKALKCSSRPEIMGILGQAFKLKVWFKSPVSIHRIGRWVPCEEPGVRQYNSRIVSDVQIFHNVYMSTKGVLAYALKRNARTGFMFPTEDILKYDIVMEGVREDKFDSFSDFEKRFDPYWIKSDAILSLWNSTSPQHGGKYKPSDFKPIPRQLESSQFTNFKGIDNTDTSTYHKHTIGDKEYETVILVRYTPKRRLMISHTMGQLTVSYNNAPKDEVYKIHDVEHCGVMVNATTYLWLEDD